MRRSEENLISTLVVAWIIIALISGSFLYNNNTINTYSGVKAASALTADYRIVQIGGNLSKDQVERGAESIEVTADSDRGEEQTRISDKGDHPDYKGDSASSDNNDNNKSPDAHAGKSQSVKAGEVVTLNGGGSSDPEGNSLSYRWVQTDGRSVELSGSDTESPTFVAPDVSEKTVLKFDLVVNDGIDDSSHSTVRVTVKPASSSVILDKGEKAGNQSESMSPEDQTANTEQPAILIQKEKSLSDVSNQSLPRHALTEEEQKKLQLLIEEIPATTEEEQKQLQSSNQEIPTTLELIQGISNETLPGSSTEILSSTLKNTSVPSPEKKTGIPTLQVGTGESKQNLPAFLQTPVNRGSTDQSGTGTSILALSGLPVGVKGYEYDKKSPLSLAQDCSGSGPTGFGVGGNVQCYPKDCPTGYKADPVPGWTCSKRIPICTDDYKRDGDVCVRRCPVGLDWNKELMACQKPEVRITSATATPVTPGTPPTGTTPPLPGTENHRPIANAGPDQTAKSGDKVVLNGLSSKEPDGDPLHYSWTAEQGADSISLIERTTAKPTFIAPQVETKQTYTFLLSVNDGKLASQAPDDVKVTVAPAGGTGAENKPVQQKFAKLVVISHVLNDNGGSKQASDFTVHVTSSNESASTSFKGSEPPGKSVKLSAGTYSVIQDSISGYFLISSGDCGGGINNGQTKICTVTANDRPKQLSSSGNPVKSLSSTGGPKMTTIIKQPLNTVIKPPVSGVNSAQGSSSANNQKLSANIETKRFDRLQFTDDGSMSITKVGPFHIIDGRVWKNITDDSVKVVAAQIVPKQGPTHVVTLEFKKVTNPKTGKIIYEADLSPTINGTNPFTGKPDTVSKITDLLALKNISNATSIGPIFNQSAIVTKIIFG